MRKLTLFLILACIQIGFSQSLESIVQKTEEKINSLNCVYYKSIYSSSPEGDTSLLYRNTFFVDFTSNREDEVIGSRFKLSWKDSSKIDLDYHDYMRVDYNWDKKSLTIDTIHPKSEMIGLRAPVPFQVKSVIRYWMAHRDSVECSMETHNDSIQLNFVIRHKMAGLTNLKPVIFSNDTLVSSYTAWLNKEYLPIRWKYKVGQTAQEEVTYLTVNKCDSSQSRAEGVVIPAGFAIADRKGSHVPIRTIEGKLATSWTLVNVEGDTVRSSDFKGRVLLMEFTGAGCGPCKQAIPFLKSLADKSNTTNVQVLSFETWETERSGLKRTKESHAINYEYLISSEELNERYAVQGVPMFVIIDKNNFIAKVIGGFKKGETDKEIERILSEIR